MELSFFEQATVARKEVHVKEEVEAQVAEEQEGGEQPPCLPWR
jgi:hypothetical protein